ncbi:hypothetical protein SNEBB_000014 [Seison nebaliae]|nr:hypothetical protein SNEBB_000014 [Seison nebaliae]
MSNGEDDDGLSCEDIEYSVFENEDDELMSNGDDQSFNPISNGEEGICLKMNETKFYSCLEYLSDEDVPIQAPDLIDIASSEMDEEEIEMDSELTTNMEMMDEFDRDESTSEHKSLSDELDDESLTESEEFEKILRDKLEIDDDDSLSYTTASIREIADVKENDQLLPNNNSISLQYQNMTSTSYLMMIPDELAFSIYLKTNKNVDQLKEVDEKKEENKENKSFLLDDGKKRYFQGKILFDWMMNNCEQNIKANQSFQLDKLEEKHSSLITELMSRIVSINLSSFIHLGILEHANLFENGFTNNQFKNSGEYRWMFNGILAGENIENPSISSSVNCEGNEKIFDKRTRSTKLSPDVIKYFTSPNESNENHSPPSFEYESKEKEEVEMMEMENVKKMINQINLEHSRIINNIRSENEKKLFFIEAEYKTKIRNLQFKNKLFRERKKEEKIQFVDQSTQCHEENESFISSINASSQTVDIISDESSSSSPPTPPPPPPPPINELLDIQESGPPMAPPPPPPPGIEELDGIPGIPPPPPMAPEIGELNGIPPPPPPFCPFGMSTQQSVEEVRIKRRKIIPKLPMKSLYWSKLSLKNTDTECIWDRIEEEDLDNEEEFLQLFSRNPILTNRHKLNRKNEDSKMDQEDNEDGDLKSNEKSLTPSTTFPSNDDNQTNIFGSRKMKKSKTMELVELLDTKRSRNIEILITSLKIDINLVKMALLTFDVDILSLDVLEKIDENKGNEEELQIIRNYVEQHSDCRLNTSEQFLLDLDRIICFNDRLSCLLFRHRHRDEMNILEMRLHNIHVLCDKLKNDINIKNVLQLILIYGNYMNGGNRMRGEAEAFNVNILTQLKDIKSRNNDMSFIQYIVKLFIKKYQHISIDETANENEILRETVFPLPEPGDLDLVRHVEFNQLEKDLEQIQLKINLCEKRLKKIFSTSVLTDQLSPSDNFNRRNMEDFLTDALDKANQKKNLLTNVMEEFDGLLKYYFMSSTSLTINEMTSQKFFEIWYQFCVDFKDCWRKELSERDKEYRRTLLQKRRQLRKDKIEEEHKNKKLSSSKTSTLQSLREKMLHKTQTTSFSSTSSMGNKKKEVDMEEDEPSKKISKFHSIFSKFQTSTPNKMMDVKRKMSLGIPKNELDKYVDIPIKILDSNKTEKKL